MVAASDTPMQEKIGQILVLLVREYGAPERRPYPDPVSVLVQTILSQNTSDANSRAAFKSLIASFDNWEDVADADINTIADCIRCGGLGRIKAQRLKQALKEIMQKRGRLELDFLSQLAPSDAENWLQRLPGVGLKTARCILLFSLRTPVLPVDTHILRVTKRLGLIRPKASIREAHQVLGGIVLPEDVYIFHILVIEHGRMTCQARHPNCQACVLKKMCASYSL
jgi:endonuclease-3